MRGCEYLIIFFLLLFALHIAHSGNTIEVEEDVLQELEEDIESRKASVLVQDDDLMENLAVHFMYEMLNISETGVISSAVEVEDMLYGAAKSVGLAVQTLKKHQFDRGGGATVFMVLDNSHISIHSWPEHDYAAIDIFTSGEEVVAKRMAAFIQEKLGAESILGARLPRGIPGYSLVNQNVLSPAAIIEDYEGHVLELSEDATDETLAEQWAHRLTEKDLKKLFSNIQDEFDTLEVHHSQWQTIEFIKNRETGDICLTLDNTVQICDSYNKAYSEVYVHLPVSYMETFESALIIGGGDALALEEVLKYKSIKRVVQLELDIMVAKLSEKYFGVNAHLPGSPNADPRVEWIFGDAAKTVVDLVNNGEEFDLLLLDISETDPSGTVSTMDFFKHVSKALKHTGIFIKNENYQQATSALFTEFVEVVFPVSMITQQTFVLGSNGLSLYLPNFKVLDENNVTTSFLARGPSSSYRQIKSLVRRYSKKRAFPLEDTIEGDADTCNVEEPCAVENATVGPEIFQEDWVKRCKVPPKTDKIKVTILNNSPFPVEIMWDPPVTDDDQPSEKITVIDTIAAGESRKLSTVYGHKLDVADKDQASYEVSLGSFEIVHQHYTHPYIVFQGVQQGLYAAVDQIPRSARRRSTPPP